MEIHDFMSQFYKKWWHKFKLLKKSNVKCSTSREAR